MPAGPDGPLPPGAACCRLTPRSCGRPGSGLCKPALHLPTGRAPTAATVRWGPLSALPVCKRGGVRQGAGPHMWDRSGAPGMGGVSIGSVGVHTPTAHRLRLPLSSPELAPLAGAGEGGRSF